MPKVGDTVTDTVTQAPWTVVAIHTDDLHLKLDYTGPEMLMIIQLYQFKTRFKHVR
jgi:hypothetical protein